MRSTLPPRTMLSGVIAMLAMLALTAPDLMAQRFQSVFGGPNCREAARYGVKQLAGGGYIAVGESYSVSSTCSNSDIYVVRANANGTPLWSFTYNIAPFDSATDVIEIAGGSFVICGVTGPTSTCNRGRDAFLLKINSAGGVLMARRYGSLSDEIAWNLIEARTGNGTTTFPGDYVVAGATNVNGNTDGYLFRTDQNLNLIWDHRYDPAGSNQTDIFYGLAEATLSSPTGNAADIVAVGESASPAGAGLRDLFVVRVSGANGTIGAAPQGSALYGGSQDDEGRAVVEIQQGSSTGNFVIAGITRSRPAPSTSQEILMLEISPNPCTMIAATFTGNDGATTDGAIDLKENPFSTAAAREVIVTGYTNLGNAVLTGENVFLQRYRTGNLILSGIGMAYGGNGADRGWSVNAATSTAGTTGFVVAGYTQSPNLIGAADPQQMYLIKTNTALSSNCNEQPITFSFETAPLSPICVTTAQGVIGLTCNPAVAATQATWGTQLCYISSRTQQENSGGNDGVSGVESPATISFSEGSVMSYPNPLASGQTLNLRFDLRSQASAEIVISDIMGRVIHQETAVIEPGTEAYPVRTDGWAAGTYQVGVRIGGVLKSVRVVIE